MKKLLILAYDFPPYVSVGGLRPYAWYKYLKEYDVYPIVVTRQWGNKYGNGLDYIAPSETKDTIIENTEYGTIIRTPYKPNIANRLFFKYGDKKYSFVRKLVSGFYEFAQYLFFIGPKSGLYKGAKQYLKNNTIDAIIATGEPFVLFKYASALSKKYDVPYVADYRDTWVQSSNRQKTKLQRIWNKYFEKKYLKQAKSCLFVSEYIQAQVLMGLKMQPPQKNTIIVNGYDTHCVNLMQNKVQKSDCFSIAFMGTIYKWHPIESVLSQLAIFVKENPIIKIKLVFYGINIPTIIENLLKEKYKILQSIVYIYPKMPTDKLFKELSHFNALLLFNDYFMMGTKIYDYLALRRKIIFCYRNDDKMNKSKQIYYPLAVIKNISDHLQEDLIIETNSGIIVENEEQLLTVFSNLYTEFLEKGYIECNSIGVEKYSRKNGVKQLAEVIQTL